MNVEELRKVLKQRKISEESFAKAIGVDISTHWRYFQCEGIKMKIGQMHKAVDFLSLSFEEAITIFLPNFSHKCENDRREA